MSPFVDHQDLEPYDLAPEPGFHLSEALLEEPDDFDDGGQEIVRMIERNGNVAMEWGGFESAMFD